MNENGRYVTPSPDGKFTYAGNGQCFLRNTLTGAEIQLHSDIRCQGSGWLDSHTLVLLLGEANASLIAYDVYTGIETPLFSDINVSRYGYSGHGKVGWGYAGGQCYYEGTPLEPQPGYWFGAVDGSLAAFRGNEKPVPLIHVYDGAVERFSVPCLTTCGELSCNAEMGLVGYGYNLNPYLINVNTRQQELASVTLDGRESQPWTCEGWIATAHEKNGKVYLHPYNDPTCIIVDAPSPIGVRFSSYGDSWLVCSWADNSAPFITTVRKDSPRRIVSDPIPPISNPTVNYLEDKRSPNPVGVAYAPLENSDPTYTPFPRRILNGMFFAATFKYGPNDDWARNYSDGVGEHLRAPGNCCVVTDESAAAYTAPYPSLVTTPDVVFGLLADSPNTWTKVKAFYLSAESVPNQVDIMQSRRYAVRNACKDAGLIIPPFFTYTPGRIPRLEMVEESGQTAIGLEFYANPSETADDLRRLAQSYRDTIPMGTPVVIWGMSYDRNGAYLGDLRPIVAVAYEIALEWEKNDPDSVKGIFYFSDGRGHLPTGTNKNNYGGARWHPEVYPVLRGIAKAIG